MSTLFKIDAVLGAWLDRLEIGMAGSEPLLRRGREALGRGEPLKARTMAHEILARSPSSPVGLALLADACDAASLTPELADTLEELVKRVPPSPALFLRLGETRADAAAAREAFQKAYRFGSLREREQAVLALADLDLADREPTRADVWLDRLLDDRSPRAALRRVESAVLRRDRAQAKRYLGYLADEAADGRLALARGGAMDLLGDAAAIPILLRALLLDQKGAALALARSLREGTAPDQIARIERVVTAPDASLRAALARARGDYRAAISGLREAASAGDLDARDLFVRASIDARDLEAAAQGAALLPPEDPLARALPLLLGASSDAEGMATLLALAPAELRGWANERAAALIAFWIPKEGAANWTILLERLDEAASTLRDFDELAALAELAKSLTLPLRVAVVGEFNAGKSTFLNALAGEPLSPMGILPTTATVFHFRFGSDRMARLRRLDRTERFVRLEGLKEALGEEDSLHDVTVFLPLPELRSIELMDTPGFNAPVPEHRARAKSALDHADALIWLLDGAQPLKHSEREELEALRALPIQFIVNKADRLKPEGLEEVLRTTSAELAALGFSPMAPLFSVASKSALCAREKADSEALGTSGWRRVEAFVGEVLVPRRESLKERALRREARAIATRLLTRAEKAFAKEQEDHERRSNKGREREELRDKVASELGAHAASVAKALSGPARACQTELDAVPREGQDTPDDPLDRYRIERIEKHLLTPLERSLRAIAPLPEGLELALRAALMQVGWNVPAEIARLSGTGLRLLLDAMSEPATAREPSRAETLSRELRMLANALGAEDSPAPATPAPVFG